MDSKNTKFYRVAIISLIFSIIGSILVIFNYIPTYNQPEPLIKYSEQTMIFLIILGIIFIIFGLFLSIFSFIKIKKNRGKGGNLAKLSIFIFFITIIILSGEIYISLKEGCDDGRGENYYFEKYKLSNVQDLSEFRITKKDSVAYHKQSCSIHWYKIKVNNLYWTRLLSRDRFASFLNEYNEKCNNCLLVQQDGWPFHGKIHPYSKTTYKYICNSGYANNSADFNEDCIPLESINDITTP